MYQGASDGFLAPTADIEHADLAWGIDYEAEVAVITDDVPYGVSEAEAGKHIALVMLVNDVSLRNMIRGELAKGFGFVRSKPASAFSPVAVTPDELGTAWHANRLHGRVRSSVNGALRGDPDAGDMSFGFEHLIAYCAKTRSLGAGTIVGGGRSPMRTRLAARAASRRYAPSRRANTERPRHPISPSATAFESNAR